ncbi:MAG: transcription termination factor Rho [Lachnospiraceae bacterium]|nr:transcription termination factor Rho [Lachnospiraceae bacterium]
MNYDGMTLQELKAAAKEMGMKGVTAMKKAELLELLKDVQKQEPAKKSVRKNESANRRTVDGGQAAGKRESTVRKRLDAGRKTEPKNRRMAEGRMESEGRYIAEDEGRRITENRVEPEGRRMAENRGESEGRRMAENRGELEGRRMVENRGESEGRRTVENRSEPEGRRENMPVDYNLDSGKEANGILEVMTDGFGFIRCANYLPGENDIYVSPAQIKRFNLKTGDIIVGNQKVKTEKEKFAALLYIKTINGYTLEEAMKRKNFEDLTPIFPDERIKLENENAKGVSMRIMDLLAPIGKGQRGMIVAPPKAGKTTLLKQIAISISRTYRNMHLIVLLIDERPEEVTDIRESIEGPNVEVIYSTFDELPEHHKRVSEMVLERAKRLVEHKEDVVILLDSITRLARAYNLTVPPSGRTLTGGLDPAALHMPKKFFGAARNMREGGSLTVLATALVETGSKMDDVVFEEFKGTGNMELVLDRKLSEKRIFPAIDVAKSGTRRDDLLLTSLEQEAVYAMHKEFSGNRAEESIEEVLRLFLRTKNNREFLDLIKRSLLRK